MEKTRQHDFSLLASLAKHNFRAVPTECLVSDMLGGSLENVRKQTRLPESKGQYQ